MKSFSLKWGLIFLVSIGLLSLGIYGLYLINPNRHREKIIGLVESKLNLKLKLGVIYPIIYPGLGVEISDLEVLLPDSQRVRPELFKARSIKFVLDLKQLFLHRNLRFRDIILIAPEFYYELGAEEKARFKSLLKSFQKQPSQPRNFSRNRKVLKIFRIDPEKLLRPRSIFIHQAKATIYDRRKKPRPLPAPLEFGNISFRLESQAEPGRFNFWMKAEHPYSSSGIPGLILRCRGVGEFSLKPFSFRLISQEAEYGENKLERLKFSLWQEGEKIKFAGLLQGEFNLEKLPLILSWKGIKYSRYQDQIRIWGKARYQMRVDSEGESLWEKIFKLDWVEVENFGVVIIDPKVHPGSLKAPLVLEQMKISLKDVFGEEPGWIKIEMPFPTRSDKGSSLLLLEGKIRFLDRFREIRFQADKARYGSNPFERFSFLFQRAPGTYSLKGDFRLNVSRFDEFQGFLGWAPILFSPQMLLMSFSGEGKVDFQFEYPAREGKHRVDYQGVVKLKKASFDPAMVIAPIENFSGEVQLTPEQIYVPLAHLLIANQPVKTSLTFTHQDRPHFLLESRAGKLSLTKLFPVRSSAEEVKFEIGEKLPDISTVWTGKISVLKMEYHQFKTRRVNGIWEYRDRFLGFQGLRFNYQGGSYVDRGSWIDFSKAGVVKFHMNGKFDGVDIRPLFQELFGYDFFVDGPTSGVGYLSGKFVDGALLPQSLNGYFKLQLNNVRLIGYNLGVRILKFLGFNVDPAKYSLDFERAKTEMIIKNGVIYFDDIEMRRWNLEAHCAGYVDLVDEKVKLYVAVYPLEALATLTKPIPLIGALINQAQESLTGSYAKAVGKWEDIKIEPYLPLLEPVPKVPEKPKFPKRPW